MLINVKVEWITFVLRILEIQGSNLGRKTVYPDRFFVISPNPSNQIKG
jgi:hypothetical protein